LHQVKWWKRLREIRRPSRQRTK